MTKTSQDLLLAIAREAIVGELTGKISPTLAHVAATPVPELMGSEGAFVTLKKKPSLALRGCIGNIIGRAPLYRLVERLACESAFHDPRFQPVYLEELEKVVLEISVLTVPRPLTNFDEIILGTHGVILSLGFRKAVFLPQVALEACWSREELLKQLAHKAGLAGNAWQDENATIEIFEALVFSEN